MCAAKLLLLLIALISIVNGLIHRHDLVSNAKKVVDYYISFVVYRAQNVLNAEKCFIGFSLVEEGLCVQFKPAFDDVFLCPNYSRRMSWDDVKNFQVAHIYSFLREIDLQMTLIDNRNDNFQQPCLIIEEVEKFCAYYEKKIKDIEWKRCRSTCFGICVHNVL